MDQQGKPAGTTAETGTVQTLAEDPVPHGDAALALRAFSLDGAASGPKPQRAALAEGGAARAEGGAAPVEDGEASAPHGETLLDLILAEHETRAAEEAHIDGVVVGEITAFDAAGAPIVTFPGAPEGGLAARALAALGPGDVGHEVALLFEGGDPARPLVMGKMHAPRNVGDCVPSVAAARPVKATEVKTDGDRVELRAEKEIVLSCGKASITLTRAGKILIRGEYVLSRSTGVHRIQGGSVEIN